jgi:tetratricopeptide (TPR) repeat protein
MGRYAKAEEYFRKVQEIQPNKFGLGHNIGLVCLAQDRFEEAEAAFLNEIERYGETFPRNKTLGDLYYMWGKREECKRFYEKSLSECEHPGDKKLISKRIEYCANEDSFRKAMDSYAELKRGNKLMAEKDYDGAYEAFQKSADLDPHNFQALNNMGALELNHRKNTAAAAVLFGKATKLTSLGAIHNNLKRAQAPAPKEKSAPKEKKEKKK